MELELTIKERGGRKKWTSEHWMLWFCFSSSLVCFSLSLSFSLSRSLSFMKRVGIWLCLVMLWINTFRIVVDSVVVLMLYWHQIKLAAQEISSHFSFGRQTSILFVCLFVPFWTLQLITFVLINNETCNLLYPPLLLYHDLGSQTSETQTNASSYFSIGSDMHYLPTCYELCRRLFGTECHGTTDSPVCRRSVPSFAFSIPSTMSCIHWQRRSTSHWIVDPKLPT